MSDAPRQLTFTAGDGVTLAGELSGPWPAQGIPIVLLHGLTATRRYVVMGSRALERAGHSVVAYDARGHGRSLGAGSPERYGYARLAEDLACLLDSLEIQRALLAGVSMGAHTTLRLALQAPQRVAALALITPAFDPASYLEPARLESWDALARGLRADGIEGFAAAYDRASVSAPWQPSIEQAIGQRLAGHEHLDAVADALEGVPRSAPFEQLEDLAEITAPAVIIGSRDGPDPGHPLAIAERYAELIPHARLIVEPGSEPAQSPIAWQGGRLSRVLLELADRCA